MAYNYKIVLPKKNDLYKETLNEAAEYYKNKKGDISTTELEDCIFKQGFIDGAKWQSEKFQTYSQEQLFAFGKDCFYKGFYKCENDDANCFTAFREEIGKLFNEFKNK